SASVSAAPRGHSRNSRLIRYLRGATAPFGDVELSSAALAKLGIPLVRGVALRALDSILLRHPGPGRVCPRRGGFPRPVGRRLGILREVPSVAGVDDSRLDEVGPRELLRLLAVRLERFVDLVKERPELLAVGRRDLLVVVVFELSDSVLVLQVLQG